MLFLFSITPVLWFGDAAVAYHFSYQEIKTTTMEGIYLFNLHLLFTGILACLMNIDERIDVIKRFFFHRYAFILLHLPKIVFFFRVTCLFLILVSCSPDYTYCMNPEIEDGSLFSLPQKYGHSRSVSIMQSSLVEFQFDLALLRKVDNEESIRLLLDSTFNSLKNVLVNVNSVHNTFDLWSDISDIVENPEDYVSGNSESTKKVRLEKITSLEENKVLRERIGSANWTFSSICAAATGIMFATAIVFTLPKF